MKTFLSRRSPAFAFALALAGSPAISGVALAADAKAPQPVAQERVRTVTGVGGTVAGGGAGWTTSAARPVAGTTLAAAGTRVLFDRAEAAVEKEIVPLLGVETGPVNATLAAQLNLTSGAGLVVTHLMADSPAAAAFKVHDILLKLDDQILIEQRQLAVLLRQRKAGDEVTLTYLRGGKETTAKVKLSQHEVPKGTVWSAGTPAENVMFTYATPAAGTVDVVGVPTPFPDDPAQVNRTLSLLQARSAQPFTMRIDQNGPIAVVRGTAIDRSNSSLVFSDDEGSLELTAKDGVKTLVAKNAKGDSLFSGPVTTEAERKAVPEAVRARLEKLEGMQDVTFRTDGSFKGTETKVVRPRGRGVSFPVPTVAPLPATPKPVF